MNWSAFGVGFAAGFIVACFVIAAVISVDLPDKRATWSPHE